MALTQAASAAICSQFVTYYTAWNIGASTPDMRRCCSSSLAGKAVGSACCGGLGDLVS